MSTIHVSKHVRVPYTYGPDRTRANLNLTVDEDGDVNIADDSFDETLFVNLAHIPALIAGLQELIK